MSVSYTYFPWVIRADNYIYRRTNGTLLSQSHPVTVGSLTARKDKVSVDTGSFLPGTYRVNPYKIYEQEIDCPSLTLAGGTKDALYEYNRFASGDGLLSVLNARIGAVSQPAGFAGAADRALQKAYAKLAQSDLGLGEDLGEIRQTIAMIRAPLKSLRKFLSGDNYRTLRELKRLRQYQKSGRWMRTTGVDAVKAATDTWLEIRYGLRPILFLLGDLMKLAEEQKNKVFDPTLIRTARSKVVIPEVRSYSERDKYSVYGGFNVWYDAQLSTVYTARAQVQYRQTSPLSTWDNLGLSPRFWPETAWDLTGLSFVWDWLFTIGPWIQTFRFKPEIEVLGNTVGVRCDKVTLVKASSYNLAGVTSPKIPLEYKCSCTERYYERVVRRSLPLLPLWTAGSTIDLWKIVDILAIDAQLLLGKRRR